LERLAALIPRPRIQACRGGLPAKTWSERSTEALCTRTPGISPGHDVNGRTVKEGE
jgi:hypothetical protein